MRTYNGGKVVTGPEHAEEIRDDEGSDEEEAAEKEDVGHAVGDAEHAAS